MSNHGTAPSKGQMPNPKWFAYMLRRQVRETQLSGSSDSAVGLSVQAQLKVIAEQNKKILGREGNGNRPEHE